MYAKIFTQIFDSSIAENYEVRHVFEDLLKLADRAGCVNMTPEAIARRTNAPLEKVQFGLAELMKPDPRSQSKEMEGRRITLLDPSRDWGWQIINYCHYREIQDTESLRANWREYKARQRTASKANKTVKRKDTGMDGKPASAAYKADERAEVRRYENGEKSCLD